MTRTADEIADAILPADGDGIHERALCLLLAEHDAAIAKLREWVAAHERDDMPRADFAVHSPDRVNELLHQGAALGKEAREHFDLRAPSEWHPSTRTRQIYEQGVRAGRAASDEPGEDGRSSVGGSSSAPSLTSSAAAPDPRAPGSTAPSHDWQHDTLEPAVAQWETDARWLEAFGGDCGPGIARRLRALAADRDRLARAVNDAQQWIALAGCKSVEDLHSALGDQIARGDALQRRLDAIATRESTEADLERIHAAWIAPVDEGLLAWTESWSRVWRSVRDALLRDEATDAE